MAISRCLYHIKVNINFVIFFLFIYYVSFNIHLVVSNSDRKIIIIMILKNDPINQARVIIIIVNLSFNFQYIHVCESMKAIKLTD